MYKIMIIEDDLVMAEAIAKEMNAWGNEAVYVKNFQNVLSFFAAQAPHLVLMDITLPFYNGYYWCGEIRKVSKVPVIFLSSSGDDMNLVMAINLGADDFVAKPFRMEVLTAKIQAVLRRTYTFGTASPSVLTHKGLTLNLDTSVLSYGQEKLELGKNEFGILRTLMEHPGKIIERSVLIRNLWETESFIDDNTLTVNVTRLRRRLEDIGLKNYILTRKGMGYYVEE